MNRFVMTAGDDREFAIIVDDEYSGDTAHFVVDGLVDKTITIDSDPGSGYATATLVLDAEDTEDATARKVYPWVLHVTEDGARLTIERGTLVLLPDIEAP